MAAYALGLQQPDYQQRRKPDKEQPTRLGGAFKKIRKYLKEQADPPHTSLYLSPNVEQGHNIWPSGPSAWGFQPKPIKYTQHQTATKGHAPPQAYLNPPPYSASYSSRTPSMATSSASGPGIFQNVVRHQYASDNILQSYDVLITDHESPVDTYWIVYIHGGYFRDPKVDASSLRPTISLIEESQDTNASALKSRIAGYASLNYRLSPHPAHPQDPKTTPSYMLNDARWPDQPTDIRAALQHLHRTYPNSKNYILAGHSVGATLAFIAALECNAHDITPPHAILGLSGIYNFPLIHQTNPSYEIMTRNGMNPSFYTAASPALHSLAEYTDHWPLRNRTVVLAHSHDDGLVPFDQPEQFHDLFNPAPDLKLALVELHGEHNKIWEDGHELVKALARTLELLE